MRINQAVILAGGLGSRLRPITDTVPKPMIPMNGKPFLFYLIDMLIENGITKIVLLLGYLPNVFTEYLKSNPRNGIEITYMIGDVNWETGTRIKKAQHLLDEHFILLYADNYLKIDLKKYLHCYQDSKADFLMTVYHNQDYYSKSNVRFSPDGRVEGYDRTRSDPNCNGIDVGFFLLSKNIVEEMPHDDFHLTHEFLPETISKKKVHCLVTDQVYYSIGNLERLPVTESYLKKKKIVLLDRDGVINRKAPKADYIKTIDEFSFLPGALDAIALLVANEYHIYIISNQAGIARKKMTVDDLQSIHTFMNKEIESAGGRIDGIYYCPHGWDDNCTCRKPKPGLIFSASRDHQFQLSNAVFIGDDERDEIAGTAAGCKSILVDENFGLLSVTKSLIEHGLDYTHLLYSIIKHKNKKSRVIVALAGQSRTGKSTLAEQIKSDLQINHKIESQILSLDNFIVSLEKRKEKSTVRDRYDYQKISEVVEKISRGESVELPHYDSRTRQSKPDGGIFDPILEGVILIEGTVALDAIEHENFFDLKTYVIADENVRKERLHDFYYRYKGLSEHEVTELIHVRYKDEYPIIHNSIQNADLIIRT